MGIGNMLLLSQVTGYVVTFIMAFFIFIPLSVYNTEFSGQCLLYATGEWNTTSTTSEPQLEITKWGDSGLCNFPIFLSVLTLPIALAYISILSIDLFKDGQP